MPSAPHVLKGSTFWEPDFPMFVTREREFFSLPIHVHDFVEIQYVAEGKGCHYVGNERILVDKGDLFIIPIGTRHVYRPASEASKDELIVYNCLFSLEVIPIVNQAYPLPKEIGALLTGEIRPYRRYKDTYHEARLYMESMYREYQTKQPGHEAVLYALLTQLLVYLSRQELKRSLALPAYAQFGTVLAYIEQNYNKSLTLTDVAKLIPSSTGYLQRMFKQGTGQSFTEYMQNLRIKKCTELLAQTSLSIREIAEMVGYRDQKFFHALFRKKTGQSPRQYRSAIHDLTFVHTRQTKSQSQEASKDLHRNSHMQ